MARYLSRMVEASASVMGCDEMCRCGARVSACIFELVVDGSK